MHRKRKMRAGNDFGLFVRQLAARNRFKAKSLISTIIGDFAVPYGGKVWVETLCAILHPLGINERSVRTTLFRLCEQGWLVGTRSGRRSFYQLTDLAASRTKLAERLIYENPRTRWDGNWTLVFLMLESVDIDFRNQLEQELRWIGFGSVAKHVWAHPCVAIDVVAERVRELDLMDYVVCMRCENIQGKDFRFAVDDREMASQCLPIAGIQEDYSVFLEDFDSIYLQRKTLTTKFSEPELAALRVLLIDQYRRIALNDPHLPIELLPNDWIGDIAFERTAEIYNRIKGPTDAEFLRLQRLSDNAPVDQLDSVYTARFGRVD